MPAIGIPAKEAMVKGRQETSVFPDICFLSAFFISTTGTLSGMTRWGLMQAQFILAPDQLQLGIFKSVAI
jgi:hypothetical protein